MLKNLSISYMRGFEGKRIGVYGTKGSLVYKKYKEGVYDRKHNKPNRYINNEKVN